MTTARTSTSTSSNTTTTCMLPGIPVFVVPCIFFLLGIGVLVPWNTFISLKSYYENRFCSAETSTTHTSMSVANSNSTGTAGRNNNIESIFATVYNVSSVLTMILLISVRVFPVPWSLCWQDCGRRCCWWWWVTRQSPPTPYYYNTITHTDNTTNPVLHDSSSNASRMMVLGAVEISDENDDNSPQGQALFGFGSLDDRSTFATETTTEGATKLSSSVPLQLNPMDSIDPNTHRIPPASPSYDGVNNDIGTSSHYSLLFVIFPFLITIFVFMIQLVLVLYVKAIPFHYNMYTITLVCIATCGITSALLGTGIITVISTLSSIIPFHQTMNPYQFVRFFPFMQSLCRYKQNSSDIRFFSIVSLGYICGRCCRITD
jgi:hypothetical protein